MLTGRGDISCVSPLSTRYRIRTLVGKEALCRVSVVWVYLFRLGTFFFCRKYHAVGRPSAISTFASRITTSCEVSPDVACAAGR